MKILFFLESLHGGGKERRSVELIRYLKEQPEGYDIELVLTEKEIYYEDVLKTGVRITILERKGMKYDPRLFLKFIQVCRRFKPDLIHTFGKMATFYAIPARILCGIPIVANLISDTIRSYRNFSKYHNLLMINTFFSHAVLSNSMAGLEIYGVKPPKGRVIYNGVRLSRFRDEFNPENVRNEFGIRTSFIVIMVATFSNFKDYDLFVDVAKFTGQRRNDVTFIAVGDGPELERIKSRIEAEKPGNVVLAGRRRDVERIISAADIGLLCTKSEGMSNSIIEYMALGKPVIATDMKGGTRELIQNGITGYCIDRDVDKVTTLIGQLLDDPEKRLSMGEKGRERIETGFSVGRMGEEFASLYHQVLAEKKGKKALMPESGVIS